MKIINNKRGSAMLWTILLTVILTILLGSLLMAASSYFNYTLNVIRNQQAYYTARSAMNAVLQQFSSYDQDHVSQTGTIYKYSSSNNPIMPEEGETITIDNFTFKDDLNMGTAEATITLNEDDEEMVDISVTATYLDKEYTMTATVARQPVYFGGLALKNLTLGNNSKLELAQNTDFYWYTYINEYASSGYDKNKVQTFDTVSGTSGTTVNIDGKDYTVGKLSMAANSKLTINGNLITQGDAKLGSNIVVNKHTFNSPVLYNETHNKTIWSANDYIITNKTMEIQEDIGYYDTGTMDIFNNVVEGDVKTVSCNNTKGNMNNRFGSSVSDFLEKWVIAPLNSLGQSVPILDAIVGGTSNDNLSAFTKSDSVLDVQYIYVVSTSNLIQNALSSSSGLIATAINNFMNSETVSQILYKVCDISYIDASASGGNSYTDSATVPMTYLVIEGNDTPDQGVYVRVKYGVKPDPDEKDFLSSALYKVRNYTDVTRINTVTAINDILGIASTSSYVVVYLGKNGTLELGGKNMPSTLFGTNPACTAENQIYFYSIYGDEGSKVILNDGMTLVGSCIVDQVEVNGDVKIIYSSTNGAQVAKQKVAEYWTVINYSD